jgi:hypothetical protein
MGFGKYRGVKSVVISFSAQFYSSRSNVRLVIGEAYPSSERTALITKQDEDEHLSPRNKDPRRHCWPCRKKRQVI